MQCASLRSMILAVLGIVAIADTFLFFAEIENRRCEAIAEKERAETLRRLNKTIETLQDEISCIKGSEKKTNAYA